MGDGARRAGDERGAADDPARDRARGGVPYLTDAVEVAGASTRLVVKSGTRLVIRADCPMDFDYGQKAGPKLALGSRRTFAGSARVIVFRKPGVYRLQAKNVQTPEERGLVTLGQTNTLGP
jgi:hypothetical protein